MSYGSLKSLKAFLGVNKSKAEPSIKYGLNVLDLTPGKLIHIDTW